MPIQSVKGTRDFYPEEYAPLRRIFDTWRRVSERHGFVEYEGPTLEMLDLYREKSGAELVGQLYRLTDSGGRELALRPEMTPTLARMVAARLSSLPRPIKWFCIPRLFRGENVQRGRLREFFQWNVDVIGTADVVADAECILVGVEALRELGLNARDFVVHISNRRLVGAMLSGLGFSPEDQAAAFALIDKTGTESSEEQGGRWDAAFGRRLGFERLRDLLSAEDLEALRERAGPTGTAGDEFEAAAAETERLFQILLDFGITEFCKFDLSIVRGLAYYTGPVFEFYDRSQSERAICGGGRYDDLLGKLGKSREPAVGFGMGDVVLSLILREKGAASGGRGLAGVLVVDAADGLRPVLHRVVAGLRRGGVEADFNYARQALGKQLRAADKRGVRYVVVLGAETLSRGVVQVKDMAGGANREASLEGLLSNPRGVLEQH